MTDPRFESNQENIEYRSQVNAIWTTVKNAQQSVNIAVNQGADFETAATVWAVPVDDAIALFETLPEAPSGLEDIEEKAILAREMLNALVVV